MFEKRLDADCCKKAYKLMLFDYNLKDNRELMEKCRKFTKKRTDSETCAMIALCSPTQFVEKGSKQWTKFDYDKEAQKHGFDQLTQRPIPIEELGGLIKVYFGLD